MITNNQIAELFEELADFVEIAGENIFKIRAYRSFAKTVSLLEKPIAAMCDDEINSIPGVGKAIFEKVKSSIATGTFPTLEKWRASPSASLRHLLELSGMNMRFLKAIMKTSNISSLDELREFLSKGNLQNIMGLDETIINNLRNYIWRK